KPSLRQNKVPATAVNIQAFDLRSLQTQSKVACRAEGPSNVEVTLGSGSQHLDPIRDSQAPALPCISLHFLRFRIQPPPNPRPGLSNQRHLDWRNRLPAASLPVKDRHRSNG